MPSIQFSTMKKDGATYIRWKYKAAKSCDDLTGERNLPSPTIYALEVAKDQITRSYVQQGLLNRYDLVHIERTRKKITTLQNYIAGHLKEKGYSLKEFYEKVPTSSGWRAIHRWSAELGPRITIAQIDALSDGLTKVTGKGKRTKAKHFDAMINILKDLVQPVDDEGEL